MSQVLQVVYDPPYFSQSQPDVDKYRCSTPQLIDATTATGVLESVADKAESDDLVLETETLAFKQVFLNESGIRYCHQEWVERIGAGIDVYDKKSNERVLEFVMPEQFKTQDSIIVQALVAKGKFFGRTEAARVLVWDMKTGKFIEQIALAHERIERIAARDAQLFLQTPTRFLVIDI